MADDVDDQDYFGGLAQDLLGKPTMGTATVPGLGLTLTQALQSATSRTVQQSAAQGGGQMTVYEYKGNFPNVFNHAGFSINGGPSYGLDPGFDWQEPSILPVPGIVEPVAPGREVLDKVTIPTTPGQAQKLQDYLLSNSGPTPYDLAGRNCSTFVEGALRNAGIGAPAYPMSLSPETLLWALHKIYDNPGTAGDQ